MAYLPQAGAISHRHLTKHLNNHGIKESKFTPGFWLNKERNIAFVLIVDNFGVKFINMKDAESFEWELQSTNFRCLCT